MLKGIDIRQRIEFTSSADTSEPKTVFVLKPLTSLEQTAFSMLQESDKMAAARFYLEKSIVEIRNYETPEVSEAIDTLDSQTLGELMTEINKINKVSGAEAKNS